MLRRLALAIAVAASCGIASGATQGGPIPVPLPLFPQNNWWNTDISAAPVDLNSGAFIDFINQLTIPCCRKLHPDWGGDNGDGTLYGFPFIIVDGSQAKKTVLFPDPDLASESDGVGVPFYPIPDEAISQYGWIEEGYAGNVDRRAESDRHILIVDKTNNHLYELYSVWYNGTNWEAGSAAFFDMNTNNRRTEGWTSADASGMALLPGLVRYDEVFGPNEITHAIRVTLRASNGHVFPASHDAGSNPSALPMGARLRLNPLKDISTFPAAVQKIYRAFKKYGLIMADNGSDMYVSGAYDNRWDMDVMNTAFNGLTASDFEVIQLGWQPATSFTLTLPSVMGANNAASATLTAFNSNYTIATGYTGTVHFTSSDGAATLPADYTFTGGDAGTHTFTNGFTLQTAGGQTVTVKDNANATITLTRNVIVGPSTPTGVIATATTLSNVNVSWTPVGGLTYEVVRASAGPYATLTTNAANPYPDGTVTAGTSYVYKVRAIDASLRVSPFSTPDAATTKFFLDDPLVVQGTTMKAQHIIELRQAVNMLRTAASLGGGSFTDPAPTGLFVQKLHIDQLRTALDQARSALGLPAIGYTDPTINAASTLIKAAHIVDLRNGVK
jgi:hypothetical protein